MIDRIDIFEQIKELGKSIDIILDQDDNSILSLVEISNRIDWFSREKIRQLFDVVYKKKYPKNISSGGDKIIKNLLDKQNENINN